MGMRSKLYAVTVRMICASFLVLAATPVWAQAEQQAIEPAEESGHVVGLLIAIVLFIALCIGCFMTPKRTHQD